MQLGLWSRVGPKSAQSTGGSLNQVASGHQKQAGGLLPSARTSGHLNIGSTFDMAVCDMSSKFNEL